MRRAASATSGPSSSSRAIDSLNAGPATLTAPRTLPSRATMAAPQQRTPATISSSSIAQPRWAVNRSSACRRRRSVMLRAVTAAIGSSRSSASR